MSGAEIKSWSEGWPSDPIGVLYYGQCMNCLGLYRSGDRQQAEQLARDCCTDSDGTYHCPYPDCDWQPSRPIDSDTGLTKAVVQREVEQHRESHTQQSER